MTTHSYQVLQTADVLLRALIDGSLSYTAFRKRRERNKMKLQEREYAEAADLFTLYKLQQKISK